VQTLFWTSFATDSVKRGFPFELVQANPLSHTLARAGDGWKVTTSSAGVPFSQPVDGGGAWATIAAPSSVALNSTVDVQIFGTVQLTQDDVNRGYKQFTIYIYDDDPLFNDRIGMIEDVWVTAENGKVGIWTPFAASTTLQNIGHYIYGNLGSSGESRAEIFFVAPGITSNVISVTAE